MLFPGAASHLLQDLNLKPRRMACTAPCHTGHVWAVLNPFRVWSSCPWHAAPLAGWLPSHPALSFREPRQPSLDSPPPPVLTWVPFLCTLTPSWASSWFCCIRRPAVHSTWTVSPVPVPLHCVVAAKERWGPLAHWLPEAPSIRSSGHWQLQWPVRTGSGSTWGPFSSLSSSFEASGAKRWE